MFFAISIICFVSLFVFFRSFYNKHTIIMSLNFLMIALQGIFLMIMLTKFSTYRYFFRIDYLVYFWMARIQIDLFTLKNLFTLTVSLSLFLNMFLIIDTVPVKKKTSIICYISAFLISFVNIFVNSAELTEKIYIGKFIHNFAIYDYISKIILFWNVFLLIGLCILLFFVCIVNSRKTNIRFIKNYFKYICIYNFIITAIRIWLFLFTPLKYYFCNYDISRFMVVSQIYDIDVFVIFPVLLVVVSILLAILFIRFRLYNVFNMFINRRRKKSENVIWSDINHVLHTYKNSLMTVIALQNKILKSDTLEESKQIADDTIFRMTNMAEFIEKNICSYDKSVMKWNEVDVKKCIDIAVERIKVNFDYSEIINQSNVNEEYIIYGCIDSISEMLFNILKNAVESLGKKENGLIKIELSKQMNWLCITIHDNGIGISKKNLKKIFNPFFSLKRTAQNWGIGLYQVKRTVEAHLGIIDVISKVADYTEFQILLPMNKIK